MSKIYIIALFLLSFNLSFSQCTIESWPLEKRINMSESIIEGKVIAKHCFWNSDKSHLLTSNLIEVYKIFKGDIVNPNIIEVISWGGTLNHIMHRADPELELEQDDIGLFLLLPNTYNLPDEVGKNNAQDYIGVASVQSFIKLDESEFSFYDYTEGKINNIETLYNTIEGYTNQKYKEVLKTNIKPNLYKALAGAVISSLSTTTANAGSGDYLVIKGSGFLNVRNKGRVEFLDANYGDGRRYRTPIANDYAFWNDTQIVIRIPSRAGTGTVKVVANDSSSFTTTQSLLLGYSHLNVAFQPTGFALQNYVTDHVNDNNKGGYTFKFHKRFSANTQAVASFYRCMETWRCGTAFNIDQKRDTTLNAIASDGTNIVRFTKYTDSRLAVCYSYYNGCYTSSPAMLWYVNELDIEADSSRNWYYGTFGPGSTQIDFQSVITHEIGHGQQLGHINASTEIMHYSIGPGERKATLQTRDLNGGNAVKTRSVANNACGPLPMVAIISTACNITKPSPGFKSNVVSACKLTDIIFTDTTQGNVTSYLWNFGEGANPQTANTKGPHTVQYATSGLKNIRLKATNAFGTDSAVKLNYIKILPPAPASTAKINVADTVCKGNLVITCDTSENAISYSWTFSPSQSVVSFVKNSITINITSVNQKINTAVQTVNACGVSAAVKDSFWVQNIPTADFTFITNGRKITFTPIVQNQSYLRWVFGDNDSINTYLTSNIDHTYPMGKAYNATLKAINKCGIAKISKAVNPVHPAGISLNDQNINIWPNPSSDVLNFDISNTSQLKYRIYNNLGQEIVNDSTDNQQIDVSNLAEGLYYIKLYTADKMYSSSFLIR